MSNKQNITTQQFIDRLTKEKKKSQSPMLGIILPRIDNHIGRRRAPRCKIGACLRPGDHKGLIVLLFCVSYAREPFGCCDIIGHDRLTLVRFSVVPACSLGFDALWCV